jgi:multidrug resistance efflux pump
MQPRIFNRIWAHPVLVGFVLLTGFALWMGWPYFKSTMVRDAAVTGWLHVATSPIDGVIGDSIPPPGSRAGSDGMVATIENHRADQIHLTRALADLKAAGTRAAHVDKMADEHKKLLAEFAETLRRDLDLHIVNMTERLSHSEERLKNERAGFERVSQLHASGSASIADAEFAVSQLAAIDSERDAVALALGLAKLRRAAADQGIYLLEDGSEADWASRLELVEIEQRQIATAAGLETAKAVADAAQEQDRINRFARLTIPPDAMIWNRFAAPGAWVVAGSPVVSWVEPDRLMVDVPLSDAMLALLRPGMQARVVVEGETEARIGEVILTRGSTATLDGKDLAAVAKGRHPGLGQALLRIEARPEDLESSPLGRAAFVDFPSVSVFQVLRVRLRL